MITPGEGVKVRHCPVASKNLTNNRPITCKRCRIGCKLLIINRKSHYELSIGTKRKRSFLFCPDVGLYTGVCAIFLANVNSSSCSLYVIGPPSVCRLSVCLSSVTFVRPTQTIEIFGNFSTL